MQTILNNRKSTKGFTIIELMISIAIMAIILAVILVNYRKFDSGIVMTNLAYDMALSIRTAQTYGVSTKGVKAVGDTSLNFDYPYGIHFDISSPTSYLLFADTNSNGYYDGALGSIDSSTAVKYNLKGSYYIKDLCWLDSMTPVARACKNSGTLTADITFLRPNPDALIYINGLFQSTLSAVEIQLGTTQDATEVRYITVRPTGQISVSQTPN